MKHIPRVIFSVVFLFATFANAQLTTSNLVGTVSGPDGLVPGATVTISNEESGFNKTSTSNAQGGFVFTNVPVGVYTVTVKADGFKQYTANKVQIEVGKDFSLNAKLELGQIQEVVTVEVGADIVNTTDAKISGNVTRKQLDDLPSLGRNPLNFVPLQAGAASNPSQLTVINGVRTSATNTTIDGVNVQDIFLRGNATDFSPARPSVDEVEEFAVSSQSSADDGFGGAQIQFTTRRGTNDFRFRLFELNRNSALAANNFFSNAQGTDANGNEIAPRPFRNRNQFGGNVGGPLIKDKLFFFFSYEKLIDRVPGGLQVSTVLTDLARQGTFTYTALADDPGNGVFAGDTVSVNLLSPAFGTGITQINPVIQARSLANIPNGNTNLAGDGLNTTGFALNQEANSERTNYVSRADYIVNDQNAITGSFRFVRQEVLRNDIDNAFNQTPVVDQPSIVPFLSLGWTYAPSSNWSNELRGGFQFSEPVFQNNQGLTDIFVLPLVTDPEVNFQNQGRKSDNYNLQNNSTVIWGNHNVRFGGQFQANRIDAFNDGGILPTYTLGTNINTPQITTTQFTDFNLFPGGVPAPQRGTANGLLALYGGIVGTATQTFNISSRSSGFVPGETLRRRYNYDIYGLYVSDQWRVRPNLTINLGLRYDKYTALNRVDGLALEPIIADLDNIVPSLLDPNGAHQFIGGNLGNPGQSYVTDKNNFAPVLSFAWSPDLGGSISRFLFGEANQSVIRGGYRISYINDELVAAPDNAIGANQGLRRVVNAINPNTGTITLDARVDNLPVITPPAFQNPPITFAQNNAAGGLFATVFAVDPRLESPMVHEYSFGYQREIGFDSAFEVRYVGTYSNNLIRGIDFNQVNIRNNGFLDDFNRARANLIQFGTAGCTPAQSQNTGCQVLTVFPNIPGGGFLNVGVVQNNLINGTPADLAILYVVNGLSGTVPFLNNPNAGPVDVVLNGSRFNYNSLQAEFRRRFKQGFSINANYTFSKNLTNGRGTTQARFEPFLDFEDQGLEYSRADFDQTHKLNVLSVYELPFGQGKSFLNGGGALNHLVGGWQISGILQVGSGAPITITDARGTLNRVGRSGRQTAVTNLSVSQLQDLVGVFRTPNGVFFLDPAVLGRNADGTLQAGRDGRGVSGNFDAAPFAGQVFFRNAPGTTSGLSRAIFNGPTFVNLDLSLIKRFAFGERFRLQLQADVFNALNNVTFTPGQFLDINSTNFGRITSTAPARVTQLGVRLNF